MEHKKQTGHVCRWMVFGITIVTIVVGCTIVIGLFLDFDYASPNGKNIIMRISYFDALS